LRSGGGELAFHEEEVDAFLGRHGGTVPDPVRRATLTRRGPDGLPCSSAATSRA
jgi:hypothetical protein